MNLIKNKNCKDVYCRGDKDESCELTGNSIIQRKNWNKKWKRIWKTCSKWHSVALIWLKITKTWPNIRVGWIKRLNHYCCNTHMMMISIQVIQNVNISLKNKKSIIPIFNKIFFKVLINNFKWLKVFRIVFWQKNKRKGWKRTNQKENMLEFIFTKY